MRCQCMLCPASVPGPPMHSTPRHPSLLLQGDARAVAALTLGPAASAAQPDSRGGQGWHTRVPATAVSRAGLVVLMMLRACRHLELNCVHPCMTAALCLRGPPILVTAWNRQLHRMQTATANIDVWHQMGQRGGTGGHTSRRGGIERDRGQVVQQWWHKTASSTRLCTACRRCKTGRCEGTAFGVECRCPPSGAGLRMQPKRAACTAARKLQCFHICRF